VVRNVKSSLFWYVEYCVNVGRALTVPLHVGLHRPFVSPPSHKSPVLLKKFQMALRLGPLTFSGSKKKGSQVDMSECCQGFTLTQYMG
jgi:hypothetical protein